jgi:hypothetical protein
MGSRDLRTQRLLLERPSASEAQSSALGLPGKTGAQMPLEAVRTARGEFVRDAAGSVAAAYQTIDIPI